MTGFDAERDLLFGTLALQTGLIDQRSLEFSLHASAGGNGKSLGQILIDQGALDEEAKTLIEALASKHVKVHGGSVRASLDAMEVAGSARDSHPDCRPGAHGRDGADRRGPHGRGRLEPYRRPGWRRRTGPAAVPTAAVPRPGGIGCGVRGTGYRTEPRGRAQANPR